MVLAAIRALPVVASRNPATAAQVQTETLGYREPRQDQLRYAAFRAQGLPMPRACPSGAAWSRAGTSSWSAAA
jgi:hypothetical protein